MWKTVRVGAALAAARQDTVRFRIGYRRIRNIVPPGDRKGRPYAEIVRISFSCSEHPLPILGGAVSQSTVSSTLPSTITEVTSFTSMIRLNMSVVSVPSASDTQKT